MNFEFSETQKQLQNQLRRLLEAKCPLSAARAVLENGEAYDRSVWRNLADHGFLNVVIPEAYGGLGLGYLELCLIAEELGHALAPVPFGSSVLATEFLLNMGSEHQKATWLPRLTTGEVIGTFAFSERPGIATASAVTTIVKDGKISGEKQAVADGLAAEFSIVAAQSSNGPSLYIVDLTGPGVTRKRVGSIDPSRPYANLTLNNAPAALLGREGAATSIISAVYDRAAVVSAFEQVGGAERALEMARSYALERFAFGRPIGSFQAVKHMLVEMYVSLTLARSNAYYGAWALSTNAPELPIAAATARVSAILAFQHCAKNNIQVHGGMGFTWSFDCHLFYRRSNQLALSLGPLSQWENALIDRMRNAA